MGREWERIHGDLLIRAEQGPIVKSYNIVDEDEDIQLCQVVPCAKSWSSSKGKVKHMVELASQICLD